MSQSTHFSWRMKTRELWSITHFLWLHCEGMKSIYISYVVFSIYCEIENIHTSQVFALFHLHLLFLLLNVCMSLNCDKCDYQAMNQEDFSKHKRRVTIKGVTPTRKFLISRKNNIAQIGCSHKRILWQSFFVRVVITCTLQNKISSSTIYALLL